MFHKLGIDNQLDLVTDLFINSSPTVSVVTQTNFIIDESVGPETGSSASFNKLEALIKSVSESIERRSSMLGANVSKDYNSEVETWDMVKGRKGILKQRYTRLSNNKTDTTGAAIHVNSNLAIYNALRELIEKNSLFLFWYGFIGNRINADFYKENKYYTFFSQNGFETTVFINDFFKPFTTAIVISYKEEDQFICGLGSDVNIEKCIEHAFKEAFLIGYMQYYAILAGLGKDKNNWACVDKINHLQNLKKLDYAMMDLEGEYEFTLEDLVSKLPKFMTELHLIYIEQRLVPNLKCVRVYSKDLINCLPLKKNIDFTSSINQQTIKLNEKSLAKIPECPII